MKVLVASGLSAYDDSSDDHKNRNIRSEILYVILRNKKVSSIFSTLAEVCPAQGNKSFGASWNGKHIVGVGRAVFEFDQKLGNWKEFVNTAKRREYSSCCSIGDKGILVAGGWEGSGKSSLEVLNAHTNQLSLGGTTYKNKLVPSRLQKIRTPFSLQLFQDCSKIFKKVVSRFLSVAIAHLTNLRHLSYIMVSKYVVTLQNHIYVFLFSQKYNLLQLMIHIGKYFTGSLLDT